MGTGTLRSVTSSSTNPPIPETHDNSSAAMARLSTHYGWVDRRFRQLDRFSLFERRRNVAGSISYLWWLSASRVRFATDPGIDFRRREPPSHRLLTVISRPFYRAWRRRAVSSLPCNGRRTRSERSSARPPGARVNCHPTARSSSTSTRACAAVRGEPDAYNGVAPQPDCCDPVWSARGLFIQTPLAQWPNQPRVPSR